MKLAVIKYNAGNIRSVVFALERMGVNTIVTDDPHELLTADKLIFPGVGEASSAMKYLKQRKLDQLIRDSRQPLLGICLGMQLLCSHSDENDTECIGIFDTRIKRFAASGLKVPQVGWNSLREMQGDLFRNVSEPAYCYFVHSYYAELSADTIAITDYGSPFCSAIARNNFYGVQFHPEKSAETGEQILKNFLEL